MRYNYLRLQSHLLSEEVIIICLNISISLIIVEMRCLLIITLKREQKRVIENIVTICWLNFGDLK